jgi:hypothetical protein
MPVQMLWSMAAPDVCFPQEKSSRFATTNRHNLASENCTNSQESPLHSNGTGPGPEDRRAHLSCAVAAARLMLDITPCFPVAYRHLFRTRCRPEAAMRLILAIAVALLLSQPLLPPHTHAAEPAKKKAEKAASTDDRGVAVVEKSSVGKRVALVIGNGSYRYTDSMPKLTNPANDADDMAAALRRFGFEVIAKKNLTKEEMDETITDFGRIAANSDAALFYYAGHGLQVRGQNYLVPVDANIDSDAKVPYRAVNVNQLLEEMESSRGRVNIVMLGGCRT